MCVCVVCLGVFVHVYVSFVFVRECLCVRYVRESVCGVVFVRENVFACLVCS